MEIILYVLMLFILLNCAFKLSLWQWWQRGIFSLVLGGFAFWSMKYAMLQSKTQLEDYLQNTVALQNMAIIVTIESVFCFGFAILYFQGAYEQEKTKWAAKLLYWYPSLLMFPVMFYVLTQTLFTFVGMDFTVTALVFSVGAFIVVPLLAEGAKILLPDETSRVEIQLLLTCFICVLGLLSTENGKMVYHIKENPVDWRMVIVSIVAFVLLFILGYIGSRLKWRLTGKFKNNLTE